MSSPTAMASMRAVDIELGLDAESLRRDFARKLFFELAKFPGVATQNDCYLALSYAVRDRSLQRWVRSARTFLEGEHRTVIYLSAEYLLGPQLRNNLMYLGIEDPARQAMQSLGLDLDKLCDHEEEPGLGNGGLGRLAACFMDSLATREVPAIGHGIRYEFGIFDQDIRNGWQVEVADRWLHPGFPWEIRRYEIEHPVGFGGHTDYVRDESGTMRVRWYPERIVRGVPYDTPILGYATKNANFLRLWQAVADREIDLAAFQQGNYYAAVNEKVQSETISKILYPNDESAAGRQLRLEQEYFFVSCALQDAIRLLLQRTTIDQFADKYAVQMNDTHPALAVAELMRLLMDEHGLEWDQAWDITHRALAYTNHTLLPEALETWPLPLFRQLLPRHMEIVFEINRRFLDTVRAKYPNDMARVKRMSLIDESGDKRVRMANLATVGSHTVNGVAELHSRLLRETVLRDFSDMFPERFTNVTNGVTPRRFLAMANPALAALLNEAIGTGWLKDLAKLRELEPFAEDSAFRERFRQIKLDNKRRLGDWLSRKQGGTLDPQWMLTAQCKRIHEYKRQHLNLLHTAWACRRILAGQTAGLEPKTVLLSGKAAPGYDMAKRIIRFATALAELVAREPVLAKWLQVVFVPDFNVKNAVHIYPAADVSEQISTAGKEASGTGNMKFSMNGALTVGTLDGANVEIRGAVGEEHFFTFGLTVEDVERHRSQDRGPQDVLSYDAELAMLLDDLGKGRLLGGDSDWIQPLVGSLRHSDPFLVLEDFAAYRDAQAKLAERFRDVEGWTRSAILNVARMGYFSSDRSIADYQARVWKVDAVPVD